MRQQVTYGSSANTRQTNVRQKDSSDASKPMTAKRIAEATPEEVSDFLTDTFDPVDASLAARKQADMNGYAHLAKFLSSPTEFQQSALNLADVMGSMFRKIRNDDRFMVDFLRLLGFFAHCFGFSRQVYTLSDQLGAESFARVVTEKILFRDCYTRNHGEFSHTLQWLVMALRFEGEWP
jgi:hypothetical protein